MAARFRDQVEFVGVYIREAHPSNGWSMESNTRVGINIEQPRTFDERLDVAEQCSTTLDFSFPVLVDKLDNRVEKAYSGFPDRLYLIDKQGRVAFKGGRGPFGYEPRRLEESIVMLLLDDARQAEVAAAEAAAKAAAEAEKKAAAEKAAAEKAKEAEKAKGDKKDPAKPPKQKPDEPTKPKSVAGNTNVDLTDTTGDA